VLVGMSGTPITIEDDDVFLFTRRQLLGHFGFDERHVPEVVRLVALGRLEFSRSVSRTYPLAEAAQAVEDLDKKVGDPIRLVLLP